MIHEKTTVNIGPDTVMLTDEQVDWVLREWDKIDRATQRHVVAALAVLRYKQLGKKFGATTYKKKQAMMALAGPFFKVGHHYSRKRE